jgi:hypothetical protein
VSRAPFAAPITSAGRFLGICRTVNQGTDQAQQFIVLRAVLLREKLANLDEI